MTIYDRLMLMAGVLACGLCQPVCSLAAADRDRPSVVVFLADDQGWGDLSLHGNKDLATPNIDSLAADGASFDRFYVCAVCAPTRAEFLTGRYHPRTGVHGVTRGAERMNLDERTVAEAFEAAGYATGCFGKWHNGMQYPYHPRARGFDTFVGYCSGHWGDYFDSELERNGEYFKSEGYITDVVTNEAIAFIKENKEKPFFCYLPLPTPHSPMQVPDLYWDRHKDKELLMDHRQADDHTRAALAMVENIDDNVGRVLKALDELELDENTIVVYFSDNGPNGRRWNGGMKGIKGSVDEGGVRVPLLVRWPAAIPAGMRVKQLAGAIDLLPTLVDLAGIERQGDKPLDGFSVREELTRPDAEWVTREYFSRQGNRVSLRVWGYRLDDRGRLYDLSQDPGQTRDIGAQQPALRDVMIGKVAAWREAVGLDQKPAPRPFTVGHAGWPMTELPARDAQFKGEIKRSSVHPNCSYLLNWKHPDDRITWDVEVLEPGRYEAIVYYTCAAGDVGTVLELSMGAAKTAAAIKVAHDPPAEGEAENRMQKGESFVKDFLPVSIGEIELPAGAGELVLRATSIPGDEAVEFRRLILRRVER